jgi:hypothetical protein
MLGELQRGAARHVIGISQRPLVPRRAELMDGGETAIAAAGGGPRHPAAGLASRIPQQINVAAAVRRRIAD